MSEDLRRTPLEAEHRALGAKLGAFGGWLLPIEYEGTLAEHAAVREAVGVFDVSHLGKVEVAGPGRPRRAPGGRSRTTSSRVAAGAAQYGMALNDEGGIVDDLIVYRVGGRPIPRGAERGERRSGARADRGATRPPGAWSRSGTTSR